jgi:hypothetical protein
MKFGTLAGLDSRPQAQMTIGLKLKTILALRPYHFDSRDSNYARKYVFFLVRVLVKARFPDSKATDPKFLTALFTTRFQRSYVENFSSLGAMASAK